MSFLPNNEASIEIKTIGENTGKLWTGSFTAKLILNNYESAQVNIKADRYNEGSVTLPSITMLYNKATAELETRITSAPDWWKNSDHGRLLLDQNVVLDIYAEVLNARREYREKLKQAAEQSESNDSTKPKKK